MSVLETDLFLVERGGVLHKATIEEIFDSLLASAAVTSSTTDGTLGQLLKVGDFGLGTVTSVFAEDCDTITKSGFYYADLATLNKPNSNTGNFLLIHIARLTTVSSQIAISRTSVAGLGVMYTRVNESGTWSTWRVVNPSPLLPFDFWYEQPFMATTAADQVFTGAAISGGNNTGALAAANRFGYNQAGVFLRSGTTANGGYRYQTSSITGVYLNPVPIKFQAQWHPVTSHTGRTVRIGYLDTTTGVADAVDGAYFECVDGTVVGKTAANSVRTSSASLALTINTPYTFDIDADNSAARFRIYEANNPVSVFDETITTTLPNSTARLFAAGLLATEVSTTASDIGILYRMGVGTVAAFNRMRG